MTFPGNSYTFTLVNSKGNISVSIKALFLLVAFGLNTVIGFACDLGIEMGFNSSHHHDKEVTTVHVHSNGEKHHHEKKETKHSHDEKGKKDNCCTESVNKFSQTDKSIPKANTIVNPVFISAFIVVYNHIDILSLSQITPSVKYFVRSYHPPIPDIRIAIQSFQI